MIKTFSTIIIDDEPLARQRLKRLLKPYDQFDIIAEAENGLEGCELVNRLKPELIFLDVEMPGYTGFEMLAKLTHNPIVIFATAYDHYAVKAFEENSIDYLLKPIEADRLERTIKKLEQYTSRQQDLLPLQSIIDQLKPRKEVKTLTVKIGDKILLVKLEDIIVIESEDKYVVLNTSDGNRYLTDMTLNSLEERLPESFQRIHRGAIINTDRIKEIRKGFNATLVFVMNDQAQTKRSSSRSYNDLLRDRFDI